MWPPTAAVLDALGRAGRTLSTAAGRLTDDYYPATRAAEVTREAAELDRAVAAAADPGGLQQQRPDRPGARRADPSPRARCTWSSRVGYRPGPALSRPGRSPKPVGTFPPPALRTRRADCRHRALQWNHAARTRVPGHGERMGLASCGTQLAPVRRTGRCVVRPVYALATATARVVPFACACDDSPAFLLVCGVLVSRPSNSWNNSCRPRRRSSGSAPTRWSTRNAGSKPVFTRKDAGLDVPAEFLAHVSPLGWGHINLTGEYRWPGAGQRST